MFINRIDRTHIQECLNSLHSHPTAILWLPAGKLTHSSQIRTFAAVIFRRIASKPKKDAQADNVDIFYSIPSEQRSMIRSKLLEALTNETSSNVRNKIGDAVAELARQYVDHKEQWNEVLGILFTLSNSADDGQREIAYRVFATTPQMIEKQYEDTVLSSFTKGFKDEKVSVRKTVPVYADVQLLIVERCRYDSQPWRLLWDSSGSCARRSNKNTMD